MLMLDYSNEGKRFQNYQLHKRPYVDPKENNITKVYYDEGDGRFSSFRRGGDNFIRIYTLTKGLDHDGTNDNEYLRDKMFAVLKVFQSIFGFEKIWEKLTRQGGYFDLARNVERLKNCRK